jgi:methionyl-tRNA synthetase
MERFFITTAIDYVNGRPHLGHAYEKVLADVLARYERNRGREVYFLTGVDEHGQKVQQSAAGSGEDVQVFCDRMTGYFRDLWARLDISYDGFARTTDGGHREYVRDCLRRLYDGGDIEFREHVGFYSVRQEQFVTEKDRVNGGWPEIYGEVVEMREPNYFFVMERYRRRVRERVLRDEDFIVPRFRRQDVLAALERPLEPLCISRPRTRLGWGIPLPFDENYVTYVWFDALLNYLSFSRVGGERVWPAAVQVIGKDILVPAHGVYWLVMLEALGEEWPGRLLVHGWWMNRGAKMSKSSGNVVDPVPYLEHFGVDAFRYFLMREMVMGQDADFTDERFMERYESDLGNDLGNLVQRVLSMVHRYRGGRVPCGGMDGDLVGGEKVVKGYVECMERGDVHLALEWVWRWVQRANRYVEERAPWRLAKEGDRAMELDGVLGSLVEVVRRLAILLEPVMPRSARRVMGFLGEEERFDLGLLEEVGRLGGREIGAVEPLFPRIGGG